MQHPELIMMQMKPSRKNKITWIQAIISVFIAIMIVLFAATAARADTLEELNRKYTVVGMAPGVEDVVDESFPYLEELPYSREIQKLFYDTWTGAGLDYVDCLTLLDMESDAKGNGVILDTSNDVSPTHDYGYFQINWPSWKKAAKRLYGVTSTSGIMEPAVNIGMAVYVFKDCVNQAKTVESRFACYNTGKPYNSTSYSRNAMKARAIWEERLNGKT